MLSYRHAFHAGNFADCLKHTLLLQLLDGLNRKDKPWLALDTHAGAGLYELGAAQAQKTGEYRDGIARLWSRADLEPELAAYVAAVRSENPDGRLSRYPGSPALIRQRLRDRDRLIACELHPGDQPSLKALFAADRRIAVHKRDGYEAAGAFLPPPERRGLLFVDPAYELAGEFERLLKLVGQIHRRWREGTVAIWYPILDRAPSERFCRALAASGVPALLRIELGLAPYDTPLGMKGSGVIVCNPPYQLDVAARRWLAQLQGILSDGGAGETRVEWLTAA